MNRDPVADARAIVNEMFPHARWAVVTGSVVTTRRTPGSDLDIVVVLPDGDPDAPHRNSLYWPCRGRAVRSPSSHEVANEGDWPVELFVQDMDSLAGYLARELRERKPNTHRMVATGVLIVGEDDEQAVNLIKRCRQVLDDGPAAVDPDELARLRYGLTDLLCDLAHADDEGERQVIAASVWTHTADLALAINRHWTGNGKWLLRELREMDDDLARRWLAAQGDANAVATLAHDVLDKAGGELFSGYRVRGVRGETS